MSAGPPGSRVGQRPPAGEPEILVLASPDAVARIAAERIAAVLATTIAARGVAHFATTGGSTPGPIYRYLVASPLRERVDWGRVQLWWGDDRFVPRTDRESNVRLVDEILAVPGNGVALPASNLHPVPVDEVLAGGGGPAEAAARYAGAIAADVPTRGGWPAFDLVIVGIGADGHLLSVFPGSEAFDSPALALPVPAPTHVEPHVPRVTLNPAILDVAGAVEVIVWGGAKAAVLGEVFGPLRDERRWPSQRARRAGATWLLDDAAAAVMPRAARDRA